MPALNHNITCHTSRAKIAIFEQLGQLLVEPGVGVLGDQLHRVPAILLIIVVQHVHQRRQPTRVPFLSEPLQYQLHHRRTQLVEQKVILAFRRWPFFQGFL